MKQVHVLDPTGELSFGTSALPLPPRAVKPVRPRRVLKALGWLIFAATLATTFALAGMVLNELVLRWFGHSATASVSSIRERHSRLGDYEHVARYTYTSPGRAAREDESVISWGEYRWLKMPIVLSGRESDDIVFVREERPEMAVRAYAIGPLVYSRAVKHAWAKVILLIPGLLLATAALLSFSMYVAGVMRPRRHRRLYTHGVVVPGTVTGKPIYSSRYGCAYCVKYEFVPAGATAPRSGLNVVPKKDYDAAVAGQHVAVLHHPQKPKHSTAYEYGGFRWA